MRASVGSSPPSDPRHLLLTIARAPRCASAGVLSRDAVGTPSYPLGAAAVTGSPELRFYESHWNLFYFMILWIALKFYESHWNCEWIVAKYGRIVVRCGWIVVRCGKLSHVVVGVVGELWWVVVATTRCHNCLPFCGELWQAHHNSPQLTHNSPTTIVASCGGLWWVVGELWKTRINGGYLEVSFFNFLWGGVFLENWLLFLENCCDRGGS